MYSDATFSVTGLYCGYTRVHPGRLPRLCFDCPNAPILCSHQKMVLNSIWILLFNPHMSSRAGRLEV